ncbi:MAG: hypothetical protein HY319_26215 [Armatimonadetes bacterium]|nr:hypothetical protein [Armatimonadota bacterium]
MIAWLLAFLLLWVPGCRADADTPIPARSRQLLLVLTPSWQASEGELIRYRRAGAESPWEIAAQPIPVTLGRSGLGWGRGLHPEGLEGPAKKEGDGRAPAGVFCLSRIFGFDPEGLDAERGLPFYRLTDQSRCIDDPRSKHYNRMLEADQVESDWKSAETMRIEPYRWGIVVDHNTDQPVPGAGSCIFLHIWESPTTPTSGCTACGEEETRDLAGWLMRDELPVLVQLPRPAYRQLKRRWSLP